MIEYLLHNHLSRPVSISSVKEINMLTGFDITRFKYFNSLNIQIISFLIVSFFGFWFIEAISHRPD